MKKVTHPDSLLTQETIHKWDMLEPLCRKYDTDGIEFITELLNEPFAINKLYQLQHIIKNCNRQQVQNIANLYAALDEKKPSRFKRWLNKTPIGKISNWYNNTFGWFHKNGNK